MYYIRLFGFVITKMKSNLSAELQKYIYELLEKSFAVGLVKVYIFILVTIYEFTRVSFQYIKVRGKVLK